MENNKLIVWEITAGEVHKFVVADSLKTVNQYVTFGPSVVGYIRPRTDMEATDNMDVLPLVPPPPPKASEFTKIEVASFIIAHAWIAKNGSRLPDTAVAKKCVEIAKAVLEEANK